MYEFGLGVACDDYCCKALDICFLQLLEVETARSIFQDNLQQCNEVSERVVQHFVRCIETHGRHMQYLKFLQTIIKAEGSYIRKCQDVVMSEVCASRNISIFILQQFLCFTLKIQIAAAFS